MLLRLLADVFGRSICETFVFAFASYIRAIPFHPSSPPLKWKRRATSDGEDDGSIDDAAAQGNERARRPYGLVRIRHDQKLLPVNVIL
jgi:hypothetical protein